MAGGPQLEPVDLDMTAGKPRHEIAATGFAVLSGPSFHAVHLGLQGLQGCWLPMRSHVAKRQRFSFRINTDERQEIRVPFVEF